MLIFATLVLPCNIEAYEGLVEVV